MHREVFVTCAVTGSGATQDRNPHVPRSPERIAAAAIDAARAGAAIVHCHVRDPGTGALLRDPVLYREGTERIHVSDVDVVLNPPAGMGGDLVPGGPEPLPVVAGTDMVTAQARVAHLLDCRPEIATLDWGTMNFADADHVMVNAPGKLRAIGRAMTAAGIRPEIEAFVTGHLWLAKALVEEGVLEGCALMQRCMGIPWGAPDDLDTLMAMVNAVRPDWAWSAFSIGHDQMPYVAAAVLAGGNVRVGLEDNIRLAKGELATNAQPVEGGVGIVEALDARVIGPEAVHARLDLQKRAPA